MKSYLIKNGSIVNEGVIQESDIFISDGRILKIGKDLNPEGNYELIDAGGKYIIPGIIDDQVHFREPGLTHKANIFTESRAAVVGGVTTFMEMPNTVPNALSQEILEEKYKIASVDSIGNYSFFMGTSNDNYDEIMKTDLSKICGLKIFMGSSTGNMLVDNEHTLSRIFANFPGLIATHCEDEATVNRNFKYYKELYEGKEIPYDIHASIRTEEACFLSSKMAAELAKKHNTRLHILHISSTDEIDLFDNKLPLKEKKITAEVCVHHMWFDAEDYKSLGNKIKCNPAIKHGHRDNLFQAMLDDKFDIIATDHAPHLLSEKESDYWHAPSGLPLVQHSLQMMMDFRAKGKISLEKIVEKMCHAPAECFQIEDRGYIREGYWADLAILNDNINYEVNKSNILYKCGWSPLEGYQFNSKVESTFVSGNLAFHQGVIYENLTGKRLTFKR